MKYKDWLDAWFANYIEPSSKKKTCERYSEIIEKHLKVKLGEYELEELSPIVIQKYITELMQSGNLTTGKGLAANSVNGIITVIQNSLKLAYTLGELKEYTTDKIRRPKTKEKEVSCFSLAEQKKIEQAALSSKKRKFIGIVICLYIGSSSAWRIVLTAVSDEIPHFAVTVTNGIANASLAQENDVVTITANAPASGFVFDKWTTEDGATFASETSVSTTLVMPAKAVAVSVPYSKRTYSA